MAILVGCLRDQTVNSKRLLPLHVFQVTLQIPGQWSCPWRAMMAIILLLLQTVPFWNLGNETGGCFYSHLKAPQAGSPENWPFLARPAAGLWDLYLACSASQSFFSSSWLSLMSHTHFPSHFKLNVFSLHSFPSSPGQNALRVPVLYTTPALPEQANPFFP